MNLAVIDIICIALIFIFAVRAMLKGFVEELFSIGAAALGIAAGFFLYKSGAAFIRGRFPDFAKIRFAPEIISFTALFLIVFIFMKFLEKIIKDITAKLNISFADRFLGLILGIIEGLCFVALIFFIIYIQPLFDPISVTQSGFFDRIFRPFMVI